MRALLLVPLAVLIVAACGFAIVHALGLQFHVKEMLTAAVACTGAGMLASVPLILTRHASQAAVAQASLVGTLIHLMVSLGAAAVILVGKVAMGPSFVYWLLAFYFATLIVIAVAFAMAVKAAPVEAPKA
jgi:hypothetical protein